MQSPSKNQCALGNILPLVGRIFVAFRRLALAICICTSHTLIVRADTAPAITILPTSQAVPIGQNATFTVEATGTAPLTYQWYKAETAISGATTASYTVTNAQTTDTTAVYSVTVSNAAGTVRSFTSFGSSFATGSSHSLLVKSDGTLWATGANGYGQLGDGSTSTHYIPFQITSNVTAVATGDNHSLFVKSDGTLWAMGYNGSGQLGDGTTINRTTPVQIATGVSAVAAGSGHSLFLKTDGSLWGMGANGSGQLGDGTSTDRPAPIQIATGVRTMSAGGYQSFFIKTDDTLWGTGYNVYGQLGNASTSTRYSPVQIATNVMAVSAAVYHTIFVKNDGVMWACGNNDYGQLGDGTYSARTSPVQIATNVANIAAGSYHTHFVKNDGTLWGCGGNFNGQLGDGGSSYYRTPPIPVETGVTAVKAGGQVSLFRKSDGTLWGMGYNYNGQLGNGSTGAYNKPIPVFCPGENPAFLTLILPPTITTQPVTQTVSTGDSAGLSVGVVGTAPFTYQWYQDGVPITGATNGSLPITSFSITKAGSYTVTVTNAAGSVTSLPANLSLGLPIVAVQTAVTGKGVSFQATNGGSGTVAWQLSTDDGQTWTTLADNSTYKGTNTVSLDIVRVTPEMNNYRFRYKVTGGSQTLTSSAATLNAFTSPLTMPTGIAVDKSGNLYLSDAAAQTVLKVSSDLKLSVIAGKNGVIGKTNGPGADARFNEPSGFVWADDGSIVLADTSNDTIRAISASGNVTTFAGQSGLIGATDGDAASALFNAPVGMSADLTGVYLVTDQANHLVRTITGGRVNTLAGKAGVPGVADATGTAATFNLPTGITIRRDLFGSISWTGGNNAYGTIFVSDQGSHTIRTILANGQVSTYVGTPSAAGTANGYRSNARFNKPGGLTMDGDGNLYVADTGNHTIRKVDIWGTVTTYAGVPAVSGLKDGPASVALFNEPEGLAFDSAKNLYVTDTGNGIIRKITPAGQVSTLAILGNVPVITTQPASQSVSSGSSASFTVGATGEGTLTYQWKKDGVAIAGATSTSYTTTATTNGSYTVVVNNAWGATTSDAAALTVTIPPPPPTSPSSPSSGGSGGGGGALSPELLALLGAVTGLRLLLRRRNFRPDSAG